MEAFYIGMVHNDYGYLGFLTLGSFHLQPCTVFPYYQRLVSNQGCVCSWIQSSSNTKWQLQPRKSLYIFILNVSCLCSRPGSPPENHLCPTYLTNGLLQCTLYELPIKNHLEAIAGPEYSTPQMLHDYQLSSQPLELSDSLFLLSTPLSGV